MTPEELQIALEKANNDIHNLTVKLSRLENEAAYNNSLIPRTNLLSDNFLTRAFAVLGHSLVANLIIVLPIYLIIFLIVIFANL